MPTASDVDLLQRATLPERVAPLSCLGTEYPRFRSAGNPQTEELSTSLVRRFGVARPLVPTSSHGEERPPGTGYLRERTQKFTAWLLQRFCLDPDPEEENHPTRMVVWSGMLRNFMEGMAQSYEVSNPTELCKKSIPTKSNEG